MASPVRAIGHARPTGAVVTWLGTYSAFTPRVSMLDNATVRLDLDNEPQPDALLRIDAEAGGRSYLSGDDYVEGPPELIVEVAASSAAYDLHDKLNAYRRNGVREYIVWRTFDGAIDWFVLADGEYRRRIPNVEGPNMEGPNMEGPNMEGPNMEGVVESRAFPGLRLAVAAMLADDLAAVLAELRRGIESPAHADFVAGLEADAKA